MLAVRVHEFGGPEVLRFDDVPVPEPGPGEARVALAFSGVNMIDIYFRTGLYKGTMPVTLGQEGGGVVEAVGPGVTDVQPGDQVIFSGIQGTYAERVVGPAWRMVPVPAGLSLDLATAALLQGMTAHYLTHSTYPLKAGEWALVHAAAGGTGQLVSQMARNCGAHVIGLVGSEAKVAVAKAAGCHEVIVYTEEDFPVEVKRLTGGRGVDVVYDSVGKTTFERSLDCLRRRGLMALYGQSSGAVPPMDPQLLNRKGSIYLTRPFLDHYIPDRAELLERAQAVLGWVAANELKVTIDSVFPLRQAREALERLASRASTGKLLLKIAE